MMMIKMIKMKLKNKYYEFTSFVRLLLAGP